MNVLASAVRQEPDISLFSTCVQEAKDETTVAAFVAFELICAFASRSSIASALSASECSGGSVAATGIAGASFVQDVHVAAKKTLVNDRTDCLVSVARIGLHFLPCSLPEVLLNGRKHLAYESLHLFLHCRVAHQ